MCRPLRASTHAAAHLQLLKLVLRLPVARAHQGYGRGRELLLQQLLVLGRHQGRQRVLVRLLFLPQPIPCTAKCAQGHTRGQPVRGHAP